jgi:hypothetical protein
LIAGNDTLRIPRIAEERVAAHALALVDHREAMQSHCGVDAVQFIEVVVDDGEDGIIISQP